MKQIDNVVKLLKCLFEPVMSHASHLRRERILLYIFKELKRENNSVLLFSRYSD